MRPGSNNRRMRGRHNGPRNNKQQTNWRQTFDSNGPDVRIRGNAVQVYEKYQNLARDASTAGDRVAAENYYQHAEHYYRILMADQQARERHHRQLAEAREAEEGELEQEERRPQEAGEDQPDVGPPLRANGGRQNRQRNADSDADADQNAAAEAPAAQDASSDGEEEAPKPRRRGRPRKPKAADADGTETPPSDAAPA